MSNLCLRCGSEVPDDEVATLHKCSECENIRFERSFFYPLEKKIKRNFQKIKKSTYGSFITGLYEFGSFSEGKTECGDIDFLITHDEIKLGKIIDIEIENFHVQNEVISLDEDPALVPGSRLVKGFWDFKTCEEYPECLDCFSSKGCNLPNEDYTSPIHTYCQTKCKKRKKVRLPDCCFFDCVFLKRQITNRIAKDMHEILTEGEIEFIRVTPDKKIKVIDILSKRSVDELKEEFDSTKIKKTLNLIRIF